MKPLTKWTDETENWGVKLGDSTETLIESTPKGINILGDCQVWVDKFELFRKMLLFGRVFNSVDDLSETGIESTSNVENLRCIFLEIISCCHRWKQNVYLAYTSRSSGDAGYSNLVFQVFLVFPYLSLLIDLLDKPLFAKWEFTISSSLTFSSWIRFPLGNMNRGPICITQ